MESLNIFGMIWILFCFQLEEIFSFKHKACNFFSKGFMIFLISGGGIVMLMSINGGGKIYSLLFYIII